MIWFRCLHCKSHTIDLYNAAAILHNNETFYRSSLAVKNLRTSLDMQNHDQSILFSGNSTWPPRNNGVLLIF